MLGHGRIARGGGLWLALDALARPGVVGRAGGAATIAARAAERREAGALVDKWTLGGIGPATALLLAGLVRERRPRAILECGPGASTIAMAKALHSIGSDARIVTLEHDARWAARVDRRLRRAGVRERVDLLLGALAPQPACGGAAWYSCVEEARSRGPFDLVFVDGPPARDGKPRRAPALPLMWDVIADGAVIVLDDANRRGERECCKDWRERFGASLSVDHLAVEKGLSVMRKRA